MRPGLWIVDRTQNDFVDGWDVHNPSDPEMGCRTFKTKAEAQAYADELNAEELSGAEDAARDR